MEGMPEQNMQLLQPPAKKLKIARVRYPNWEKQETLALVKSYQRQVDAFTNATSKGRMAANEQKWVRISSLCGKEGVSRDAEQCRKRWQDLSKSYKCIKEWEGDAEVPSFWLMSSSSKKDKKLPASFDRETFDCMDAFLGSKAVVKLLSEKAGCESLHKKHDVRSGCLEGRSSALAAHVESQGDPSSSQEDSWPLPKERKVPPRDRRKHAQSFQTDSGVNRGDPIAEAVEQATRLAQEECRAQVTEVLAEVLLKIADAMKAVAENMRKQSR